MQVTKPDQVGASVAPVEPSDGGAGTLSAAHSALIARLFSDHADPLRRYIASRFGAGPPEPEEVAQAAFAKLASTPALDRVGNLRAFLYTIACNLVISHRRQERRRDAAHRDICLRAGDEILSGLSPERVLMAKEQLAVLEAAMKAMPAMRRRIFLMVRVEGTVPAKVAHQFGISENAVHRHVSRGLADVAAAFARADRRGGYR